MRESNTTAASLYETCSRFIQPELMQTNQMFFASPTYFASWSGRTDRPRWGLIYSTKRLKNVKVQQQEQTKHSIFGPQHTLQTSKRPANSSASSGNSSSSGKSVSGGRRQQPQQRRREKKRPAGTTKHIFPACSVSPQQPPKITNTAPK